MSVDYHNLPDYLQELIDDVKVIMGDIDEDEEDRMFTDNQWATILQTTVRDFDRTRPPTNFGVESFPQNYQAVLELGILYFGALARSNHLLEDVPIVGYAGPNVDTSQLHGRWSARARELQPVWINTRNRAKLEHLPKPVGTVNQYNWFGTSASVIPFLRALPSWSYDR